MHEFWNKRHFYDIDNYEHEYGISPLLRSSLMSRVLEFFFLCRSCTFLSIYDFTIEMMSFFKNSFSVDSVLKCN